MLIDEKKKLSNLEEKLRQIVSKQWEHLHKSIRFKSIHPVFWGHKTRTLRRSRNHAGASPPLRNQQVPPKRHQLPPQRHLEPLHSQQELPQPVHCPPPEVQNRDEYTNKSRILTFYEDGDWQVGLSEDEDSSSEISSQGIAVSREIFAEVHALDNEPFYQGITDSPTTGIEGVIYGDDITSVSPSDRDAETDEEIFPEVREGMPAHPPPYFIMEATDREQHDEDFCPEVMEAMLPHPPPFFSITERDEWLALHVDQKENGYEEDDAFEQSDDDVPRDVCSQSSASVQDPYLSEFRAFYANYEEGSDYLYYRDDDDEAEIFEEEGD